jgi:hypothetical protein
MNLTDATPYRHSAEDRQKHFNEIHARIDTFVPPFVRTRRYRNRGRLVGPGEDVWAAERHRPMADFGPFVPVFAPFTRMFWQGGERSRPFRDFCGKVLAQLQPEYLYVTLIVQSKGIQGTDDPAHFVPRNLFILSPGGCGHIPMLLWSTVYKPEDFPIASSYRYDCVFMGVTWTSWVRRIGAHVITTGLGDRAFVGTAPDWRNVYASSKFILVPRGGGRNSYRLAEVLQMGMVPVCVYDDFPWLPYYDSINWSGFAIVVRYDGLRAVVPIMQNETVEEVGRMRRRIRELYDSHFSVAGMFRQVFSLLRFGFARSDLRCAPYSPLRTLVKPPAVNFSDFYLVLIAVRVLTFQGLMVGQNPVQNSEIQIRWHCGIFPD